MSDTDGTAGRFTPLLAPLGWLYAAGVGARCALYDRRWFHTHRLAGPVLSVGNLTVGGTGKTPLVIFLAEMLQKAGRAPSILTRGYRRRPTPSWVVVEPGSGRQGGAAELGDEPALMARRLPKVPIVVSADRYGAGRVAESRFQVGVHLLDDGFQHLRLHRDLNLLVLDATQPFRTGRLLPGGRLRERPAAARRADLIVITRGNPDSTFRLKAELEELGIRCPTFSAQTRLRDVVPAQPAEESPPSTPDVTRARSALAFCGVGNPAAFFADLDRWGFTAADRIAFRDHHRYSESDCRRLIRQARKSRAEILLTTEKDQLNLPDGISWEIPLYVCCIDLEVSDEDRFSKYVLECLERVSPERS